MMLLRIACEEAKINISKQYHNYNRPFGLVIVKNHCWFGETQTTHGIGFPHHIGVISLQILEFVGDGFVLDNQKLCGGIKLVVRELPCDIVHKNAQRQIFNYVVASI